MAPAIVLTMPRTLAAFLNPHFQAWQELSHSSPRLDGSAHLDDLAAVAKKSATLPCIPLAGIRGSHERDHLVRLKARSESADAFRLRYQRFSQFVHCARTTRNLVR